MSRVLGPLLSLSATKTFGKTLTFSTWKGINTVRLKSNPSNPQTTSQMAGRAYFAAGGKVSKASDPTEVLATFVKAYTPAQQSWISYFVREMLGSGNANIIAAKAIYENGTYSTIAGYFDDAASQAGIESVDLDGTSNTQVPAGLALMAAYTAAYRLGFSNASTVVTSVDEAGVFQFTEDLTGVTPS